MSRKEKIAEIEVPPKMRLLDRDRRGYPIPWIVQRDLDRRPFFTINDVEKVLACGHRKVCGICGHKLERDVWLIGGPGAAFHEHGAYLDPPMHKACATYALRVCPYLGARYTGRVEMALAKHGRWHPAQRVIAEELMIPEQPPFFVLAQTSRAPVVMHDGAPRFHPVRPWKAVEFWVWGRQVSEAEARSNLSGKSDKWPWTPEELPFWKVPEGATE